MTDYRKRTVYLTSIIIGLIMLAIGLRHVSLAIGAVSEGWSYVFSACRSLIYIGLFTAWGVSVRYRIIQKTARRYLVMIAALIVFWMVVRSIKFSLPPALPICRYLWYLYYVPMISIPLLGMLAAFLFDKPETAVLGKKSRLLWIPAILLIVLVLTNDIHELAFAFPQGRQYFEWGEYTHEIVYFLSLIWVIICVFVMLIHLVAAVFFTDWRRRIWLPLLPLVQIILYWIFSFKEPRLIKLLIGDMTVFICLVIVEYFECCFLAHLIQTNTRYVELFHISAVSAYITDDHCNLLLSADSAQPLDKEELRRAKKRPVILDGGLQLSSAPIQDGYSFWLTDVSKLTDVIAQLMDENEYLDEERSILQREVDTKSREQRLTQQNRLYNELMNRTEKEIERFSELIDCMEHAEDEKQLKRLTLQLAIVCIHIKRRGNLVFLAEDGEQIEPEEASFAIEEWLSVLRLSGISCESVFSAAGHLSIKQAEALYDAFGELLLKTADSLRALFVRFLEEDGQPCLLISLSSDSKLSDLKLTGSELLCDEDGEWLVRIGLKKGGGS